MSIITWLTDCFPIRDQRQYAALAKKDDNFGIEQAQNWVKSHPIGYIQTAIRYSTVEKIHSYADEVIKSLRKIPITSSNVEILKSHLVEMSKKSDLLKQDLINKIRNIKAEKSLIVPILDTLGSTFEVP